MGIVEQYLLQLKTEKRRLRRTAVVLTALSLIVATGVSWNLRMTGVTLAKHYIKRKADLDYRLYKMYDKIEDTESLLIEARAKKTAIEAEKLTADHRGRYGNKFGQRCTSRERGHAEKDLIGISAHRADILFSNYLLTR